MAVTAPSPPFKFPVAVTSAFGRFFYAADNVVYYSQTLTSAKAAGRCYQANDPTSDEAPDILDTDGGVIPLDGAVNIKALEPFRSGVLIFAENGLWYVYNPDGGFKATSFNLTKVTDQGLTSVRSVIVAEGSLMYFSSNGIIQITANEFDNLIPKDITQQTIRKFYLDNYALNDRATASYDSDNKTVHWFINGASSRALFLDLRSGGFYPQEFSQTTRVRKGVRVLNDYLYAYDTSINGVFRYSLADTIDTDFNDFGVNSPAYMITGYETLGKFSNKKAIAQCMALFNKTETQITGYVDNKYTFDLPSSCLLQVRWDFDKSDAFKKWVGVDGSGTGTGQQIQMYNPIQRGFIPTSFPFTFDTGESVINKRVKLRGNGKAVQFKFEAEPGKDLQLLGYTVDYSMRGKY